jgi:spermidine/putrescine transport system substrate-binding protein
MRHPLLLAAAVCAAALLVSCNRAKPVLHVYNWSDYMKPELLTRFEKENNCTVVMDLYDANEVMYAKIKAGASGYDVCFPSSYFVSIMEKQGMLQPIKHDLLPNLKNIDRAVPRITEDSAMHHSVPYMVSATGFGFLKSRVKDVKASWTIFDRVDLKGRITMLNDPREVLGAALKLLGYSINTTVDSQLAQARDVAIRWKRNIAKYESDQYKNGLVSGEFLLCQGYNGDVVQLMADNKDVGFLLPAEGTLIAVDNMVVLKESKMVALAHTFINFMLDPAVSAENMEFLSYMAPNIEGKKLLPETVRSNPAIILSDELIAHSEVLKDLGDDNAKYNKYWDEIKAAK